MTDRNTRIVRVLKYVPLDPLNAVMRICHDPHSLLPSEGCKRGESQSNGGGASKQCKSAP